MTYDISVIYDPALFAAVVLTAAQQRRQAGKGGRRS
jgi:hypothetical protein